MDFRCFLVIVLFLVLSVQAQPEELSKFSFLEDVKIAPLHANQISVSFRVASEVFSAPFQRDLDIFGAGYELIVRNSEKGSVQSTPKTSMDIEAYKGFGVNATRHRLVIINKDHDNPIFMGSVRIENMGDMILDPASRHPRARELDRPETTIAFKLGDFQSSGFMGSLKVVEEEKHTRDFPWSGADLSAIDPANLGAQLPLPSNCPQSRTVYQIGFVVNYIALRDKFSGSPTAAEAEIAALVLMISARYESDINIRLTLNSIIVLESFGSEGASPSTTGFNREQCNTDILQDLYSFGYYRGNDLSGDTTSVVFQLITDCYQLVPNQFVTVGIAWTNIVGLTSAFQNGGRAGEWVSAVGVNSYVGSFWATIAHEIGHNFGAGHDHTVSSSKGIMSYYDDAWEFSRVSQSEICNHYSSRNYQFGSTGLSRRRETCSCSPDDCGYIECGDGTRVECSTCPNGHSCISNTCVDECEAPCGERVCGSNLCQLSCGTCESGEVCSSDGMACSSIAEGVVESIALDLVNQERDRYSLSNLAWSEEYQAELSSHLTCDNYQRVPTSQSNFFGSAFLPEGATYADYLRLVIQEGRTYFDCDRNRFGLFVGGNQEVWDDDRYFRLHSTPETERYRSLVFAGPQVDGATLIACADIQCEGGTNPDATNQPWSHVVCTMGPLFSKNYPPMPEENCVIDESECDATTCQDAFLQCGTYINSCGNALHCGECEFGSCENGKCTCLPQSCESLGNPGSIQPDGCGAYIDCSATAPPSHCNPPETVCLDEYGITLECGLIRYAEGCDPVQCGTCNGNTSYCNVGFCTECNAECSIFGTCTQLNSERNGCGCREGFVGDGGVCVKESTTAPCGVDAWDEFFQLGAPDNDIPFFTVEGNDCGVRVISNTSKQCEQDWPECGYHLVYSPYNERMEIGDTIHTEVILNQDSEWFGVFVGGRGFLSGVESVNKMVFWAEVVDFTEEGWKLQLRWKTYQQGKGQKSGKYDQKIIVPFDHTNSRSVAVVIEAESVGIDFKKEVSVVQFRLSVNGETHSVWGQWPKTGDSPIGGSVGLEAEGDVLFTQFSILTRRSIRMELFGCPEEEEVRIRIAALLGIGIEEIQDVLVECSDSAVSRARSGGLTRQVVLGSSSVVTVTIVGQNVLASALTTQFGAALAQGLATGFQSAMTPGAAAAGTSAPSLSPSGSISGGSGATGLSSGAIAGITVGATAGAFLTLALAVALVGNSRVNEMPPEERSQSIPARFSQAFRAGIPVMNPESATRRMAAGEHQTATGRAAPT